MIFHKIEDWCFRWIASSAKSSLNLCPHQHHQLLKKILVNGFENKNISKHWTPPQVWPNLVSLKVTRICAMHLQQTMARVMIDMNRNKTIFFWEMQLLFCFRDGPQSKLWNGGHAVCQIWATLKIKNKLDKMFKINYKNLHGIWTADLWVWLYWGWIWRQVSFLKR